MPPDDLVGGATRLFGIVGDPVAQVRTPAVLTARLRALGHDAILLPFHAPADRFETVVEGLMALRNLDGLVFTIPFKGRAMAFADEVGPEAEAGGGINALARRADGRWSGEMFDGLGCLAALREAGYDPAGRRVLLIGAGGAGTSIGLAVARTGPARMRIADTDPARAVSLAGRIRTLAPDLPVEIGAADPAGADMILNASPMGMADRPDSPLSGPIERKAVVFDAVAKPAETRLMADARAAGAHVVGGEAMIRGQSGLILEFLLNQHNERYGDST